MSLSLVYRASTRSLPLSLLTPPTTRHASRSAIHRGLIRSHRATQRAEAPDPRRAEIDQLYKASRVGAVDADGNKLTYRQRHENRAALEAMRPQFKIRRGKKDITDYPDVARPKSRAARFMDPGDKFGKRSLVYKMKMAAEKARRGGGGGIEDVLADEVFGTTGTRPDRDRQLLTTRRQDKRGGRARRGRGRRESDEGPLNVADVVAELSRPIGGARAQVQSTPAVNRGSEDRGVQGRDRGLARKDTDDLGSVRRRDRPAPERPKTRPTPTVSIPYTTAASQFLYGRSVVEAALRASRRKLYRLYIYDGANRENTTSNTLMARLAKKRGVPVEIVKEGGLRLFDKLSQSRPHNGFILEASPLPRPLLTALGPIPPDYTTNPRIPLELGHQSAEDAEINGTPTTLPAPPSPGHKPLVIVLDKVLDPGNLGAILRTVSFMGATAVGITKKHSASLTAVALKASAGAAESLALFSVNSLPDFITLSRANGWSVYAAVAGVTGSLPSVIKQRRQITPRDIEDADPLRHEPCMLVIGNEGDGLERLIVKKGDYELSIPNLAAPGSGVDSLNVNVAAALLCSAFLRGVNKELEEMGGVLQRGVVGGGGGGGGKVAQALW
ncbi:uncharacterized protein C8A04DRAFT_11583 [Dichotomopilus funicola]|uniref:rRNA methyltransferase 1, mitochondrial n=1 Tax=Dichotomopilus funicola TaxID=1934379 RepID=A0AAN6ZNN1_9PEZI|nr:hypothetical protein C8A04DRAFT_11583 [Dichotomopilus funicola]